MKAAQQKKGPTPLHKLTVNLVLGDVANHKQFNTESRAPSLGASSLAGREPKARENPRVASGLSSVRELVGALIDPYY